MNGERSDAAAGAQMAGPGPLRIVATSASALVCATLPMFLLGALAPRIIADLALDERAIGAAVAVFFLAAALSSVAGGRLTDRIGASAALRLSVTVSAASALGIAVFGASYGVVLALLVVAGAAVPLADTGGARAIAAGVPLTRQGVAFGGKEASIPVASLLAGLAVPVLGAQFGWRPAFAVASIIAVTAVVLVPPRLDAGLRGARAADRDTPVGGTADGLAPTQAFDPPASEEVAAALTVTSPRMALVLLSVAAGLGGGAANSAPTFLVASSVDSGLTEGTAGILLAVASAAGIASRLASGVVADRRPGRELMVTGSLMVVGSLGLLGLAFGSPVSTVMGAIAALGGGWGWTGLAFLGAVRLRPEQPARAAGAVLAGLASGGALGPLAFGALAAGPGYPTAWAAAAGAMSLGAALAMLAHRAAKGSRASR